MTDGRDSVGGLNRLGTCGDPALAPLVAPLVDALAARLAPQMAEVARLAAREELERGAAAVEWLTQPRAAAIAGVRPQTIRAWQGAGKLTKGRRGRVNAEELRRFLAASGRPEPAAALDLSRERVRRAAAEILRKGAR